MLSSIQHRTSRVGDNVFAASRQLWLAGLGAAVVTRDWASREAANTLRKLVREGSAVELRAVRFVGDRVESSVGRANAAWKKARTAVETTVRTYADTAVTLVRQTLPKSLPSVELPAMMQRAPAKTKTARAPARKSARSRPAARGKRGTKAGAKR